MSMEPKRTTPFRGDLLKDLRDPTEATNYVVVCAAEGAADVGVRDVMEAARLQERARCAKIARENVIVEDGICEYAQGIRDTAKAIAAKIEAGE